MPKVRVEQINYPYTIFSGNTGSDRFYLGKSTLYSIIGYSGITTNITDGQIVITADSGITTSVNTYMVESSDVTISGLTTHSTNVSISNKPYGYVSLSLNGLEFTISEDTSGFFFGTGVSNPLTFDQVDSGSLLYFNPSIGFNLDIGDEIIIKYLSSNRSITLPSDNTYMVESSDVTISGLTTHSTNVSISNKPYGYVSLSLNGLEYTISEDTSGPFFFGTDVSSPLTFDQVDSGSLLYFNPSIGFNLDIGDEIIIKYLY